MMTNERESTHFSQDDLLDYFEEKLPMNREQAVEEHIAECSPCAVAARQMHDFHRTWDAWTASSHRQALLQGTLSAALRTAEVEEKNPDWSARLKLWRSRWTDKAEAVIRVVSEVGEEANRVVAEVVESLARPAAAWQFETAQVPIRGAAEPSDSALLTTKVHPGQPRARVAVRGGELGEVVVRVDGPAQGGPAPLVLLVETSGKGAPTTLIREVEPKPGTGYGIARFEGVAPGDYLVVFEPFS